MTCGDCRHIRPSIKKPSTENGAVCGYPGHKKMLIEDFDAEVFCHAFHEKPPITIVHIQTETVH